MGRNDGSRGSSSNQGPKRRSRGPKTPPVDVDELLWQARHGSCRREMRQRYNFESRTFVDEEVWWRSDGSICRDHDQKRSAAHTPVAPRGGDRTPIRPTSARDRKAARNAANNKQQPTKGRRNK